MIKQLYTHIFIFLFVVGCIGCSSDDEETARVLIVHASSRTNPIRVVVDDDEILSGISYKEYSVDFGINVEPSDNSDDDEFEDSRPRFRVYVAGIAPPVIDERLSLQEGVGYIYIVYRARNDSISRRLIRESTDALGGDDFRLRFSHFANSIDTAIDSYVVSPEQSLVGQIPAAADITFSEVSPNVDIVEGIYKLVLTQRKTLNPIFESTSLPFQAGERVLVVLLDSAEPRGESEVIYVPED